MPTCYINLKEETILGTIRTWGKDKEMVVPIVEGIQCFAPSKKKPYHRIKIELSIPQDAINDNSRCILPEDIIPMLPILFIPEKYIQDEYLEK